MHGGRAHPSQGRQQAGHEEADQWARHRVGSRCPSSAKEGITDGGGAGRPTLGRHRAGQKRALWFCWTPSLVHAVELSPQRPFLPWGLLPLLCSSLLSCLFLPESQPGPQSNPHLLPHPGLLVQAQGPKERRLVPLCLTHGPDFVAPPFKGLDFPNWGVDGVSGKTCWLSRPPQPFHGGDVPTGAQQSQPS